MRRISGGRDVMVAILTIETAGDTAEYSVS